MKDRKKILIIGVTSYIGTSFANWVLKYPHQYIVESCSSRDGLWKSVDFSMYDAVINVAGICHVDADPKMEALYYRINRDLCEELAKKSKESGVKQFIFLSSMIVFDNLTGEITNQTIPNPNNFYGKSKLQADQKIHSLQSDLFNVVSIRPPIVYGPNSNGNFQKLYNFSVWSPLFPNLNNKRSMIYIDNLSEFIRLTIDNFCHGIFYPQNNEYVNVSETAQLISALEGRKIYLTQIFNPLIRLFLGNRNIINKIFADYYYHQDMSLHDRFDYNVIDFKTSLKNLNLQKKHEK
jgi:nucleoside-diphosphate-sugar epimerase